MTGIIVAFLRPEDARSVRGILVREGYEVAGVCTSAAQVISLTHNLDGGIVVCGYRLSDMHYSELYQYLPEGYRMLLVASPAKWMDGQPEDIVCLEQPIRVRVLLQTLEGLLTELRRQKKKQRRRAAGQGDGQPSGENGFGRRSEADRQVIIKAKELLMERNHMSEGEAHRYIQKISMDSGNSMVETAGMVLALMQIGE